MRILIVSHYVLPHTGGIEVLVHQMTRLLVSQGHRVTVVASDAGFDGTEPGGHAVGEVVRVPAWNGLEARLHVPYPIFSPRLFGVLRRSVRESDMVHVHGVMYLGSLVAMLWALWFGKPLVVTEHVGFLPYRSRVLNAVERLVLAVTVRFFARCADALVAYNTAVHGWLARHCAAAPERLHFIRNGIDLERFRPASDDERRAARAELGLPADRPLALFVGRLVEKKGLDLLAGLGGDGVELVVCGPGESGALPAGIHRLGNVAHERMPLVYRAADLFVLPSRGEGFPVSIMEAMACGLPVVVVRDPTYDAYATDAEILQVEPDVQALRAAVLRLLASPEERRERGAAARRLAERSFGVAANVQRHLDLYEQVRGYRRLSAELAPLGHDIPTRIKVPELRGLLGPDAPGPRADIGPGSGYTAHHVLPPGPVIVVDVSEANLRALRARASRAGCPDRFVPVRASLLALPFRDGALGTVLCAEVLEHMADDRAAAAELARVLGERGRLIVEVPDVTRGYASFLERLGVRTVHDVPGPEYHHRPGYTAASLRALFEPLGLRVRGHRRFVGWVAQAIVDCIAAAHLFYERRILGRQAWTWSDVQDVIDSRVFRLYKAVFPILRMLTFLDRVISPRHGFTLAARLERGDSSNSGRWAAGE